MIETFYEQVREFGVLVSQDKQREVNTYIYNGSTIDIYFNNGEPMIITISKE